MRKSRRNWLKKVCPAFSRPDLGVEVWRNSEDGCLFAAQDELISVRILELREGAPGLDGRGLHELDAPTLQLLIGLLHVIARERTVDEGTDSVFVPFGREKHNACFCTRDLELDPTLFAHGLV